MDFSQIISILGTVVQAYASLLGIVGMYAIFLKQRKDDITRERESNLLNKAENMVDFINREIAPVYPTETFLHISDSNIDIIIDSATLYEAERKKEIPPISNGDVKKLITLWSIVHKEKEQLTKKKKTLSEEAQKPIMPKISLLLFVGFFAFVLVLSFVSILFVSMSTDQLVALDLTQICIILAILGILPLGNLLYQIR